VPGDWIERKGVTPPHPVRTGGGPQKTPAPPPPGLFQRLEEKPISHPWTRGGGQCSEKKLSKYDEQKQGKCEKAELVRSTKKNQKTKHLKKLMAGYKYPQKKYIQKQYINVDI